MRKPSTKSFRSRCIILPFLLFVSQVVLSQIIIKDTINIQPRSTIKPDFIVPPPPPEDTTTHSELLLVDSTTYDQKSIKPNFDPDSFQVKIDWNISVANFYNSLDPWSFDLSDSPRGIFSRLYQTVILPYTGTSTLSGSAIVASNYTRYAFQVGYGGFPADVRANIIGDTAVFIFTTNVSDYIQINGTLVLSLLSAKKQLTIVTHQPWTIWPTLPPRSAKGLSGYDHKRNFSVQVLDASGQPVTDEEIKITTDFIPFSGGHNHNDPALEQGKQGVFYGQSKHNNPLELSTDGFGIAEVDSFIASEISGSYLVTAFLAADTTIEDTVNLIVKVPGLELLGEGTNYVKVGGTYEHHGPRTDANFPTCRTPDNNHSGNPAALTSLQNAAREFRNASWNRRREMMRINDISLPFGGSFDTHGNWLSPHDSHRMGRDVDIENISRLAELRRVLEPAWRYILEGPTFYPHFRFTR